MSNPQGANPPQIPNSGQAVQSLSIPDVANQWTGNLTSEDPADKQHRLQQEAYDARHTRWRMNFIILVAVFGLGFVLYLCFLTLNDSNASPIDKRWATAFVSSMVIGSVGFLTGKAVS